MRWRPVRAGILNIWEYDDQVFDFGDGRLVLRGRNGSGKSNALSLLFPFLLDGVMSAPRMDPMGGSRSMKSLLLGRDDDDRAGRFRHDSGTGYVWMEFYDGDAYLSIGIGASATVHRDAVPWFFVADGRVGDDVQLIDGDVPLGRGQLTERLPVGAVVRTAEEYRSMLDRRLFGLGPARYRSLVDLLLTLRRPHLAGKLDTDHLSATLSAGLGEVDVALVEDVAHSFDDLDAMQHELEGLSASLEAVQRFLPVYRDHLLAVGRERAEAVTARRQALRSIDRRQKQTEGERAEADTSLAEASAALATAQDERRDLDATIENIQQSPAYQSSVALAEVEKAASNARASAEQAQERVASSAEETTAAQNRLEEAEAAVAERAKAVDAAIDEWLTSAAAAGIEPPTRTDGERFDDQRALAAVVERRHQLEKVQALAIESAEATSAALRAEKELDECRAREAAARAELHDAHHGVHHQRVSLAELRARWLTSADEPARALGEDDDAETIAFSSLFRTVEEINDGADAAAAEPAGIAVDDNHVVGEDVDLVAFHHADRWIGDRLNRGQRAVDRAEREVSTQRDALEKLDAERDRVASKPNPGPDVNGTRPDAGTGIGAPLYVCVDFADGVDPDARAGLEAALHASGLLDARITADGSVPDLLDAVVTTASADAVAGPTLADVLVPVPVEGLGADAIGRALASVPLDGHLVELHRDGRWRLGPLAGRYRSGGQQFIGHAARERRRAARLADLDTQLSDARAELTRRTTEHARLVEACAALDAARTAQPSGRALERALQQFSQALVRVQERASDVELARHEADGRAKAAEDASHLLARVATVARLPEDRDGLRGVRDALLGCDQAHGRISDRRERLDEARSHRTQTEAMVAQAMSRADHDRSQASKAEVAAKRETKRYEDLKANVGGDAQEAVESLSAARNRREQVEGEVQELGVRHSTLTASIATFDERLAGLRGDRETASAELEEATARFAVICSSEVADVIAIDGVDPTSDPGEAAKRLLARAPAPTPDATNRMERAHREILLDGLRSGHDPSMPKVDGVDVIRVGTVEGELPIGTLARSLQADHERTSMLLSDREREIFETHLLTNVGESLRSLLLEADAFEHRINAEMAKTPTESGMTVELSWEIADDEPDLRGAIKALRTNANLLGADQRGELRTFFMRRISDLRSLEPGRSFAETLTTVLDYRSWHRFALHARFTDGKRQRVTKAFFKGLSGGEAATLLHLPLFAAAASQYSSGTVPGPRLIALDEAFAGIDDQMRSRLMGLLTQLDLDVILTSHEFWGFYGSVPSLVLYDLVRKPPNPGVFAQRFDWTADDQVSSRLAGP